MVVGGWGISLSLVGRGAFEFAPTFNWESNGKVLVYVEKCLNVHYLRAIGRGVGAVQNWRVCTHCYVLLRVLG